MSLFEKLRDPPRTALIVLMILTIAVPMYTPLQLPLPIDLNVQEYYDTYMTLEPGDTVFVSFASDTTSLVDGGAGSVWITFFEDAMDRGLNLVLGIFEEKSMFAFVWWMGEFAEPNGYADLYGERFVCLGYFPGQETAIAGVLEDLDKRGTDYLDTPLSELSVMDNVYSALDLKAFFQMSKSRAGEYIRQGSRYEHWPLLITVGVGDLSGTLPYYTSGQIDYIAGQRNVAMWEALIGRPFKATQYMDSQTTTHVLFIGVIILTNIVHQVNKRRDARAEEELEMKEGNQ